MVFSLLNELLTDRSRPATITTVEAWWNHHHTVRKKHRDTTIRAAIRLGFLSDRPAWAFASGYTCALSALLPQREEELPTALCVTERGGNTPKHLQTTVTLQPAHKQWILSGHKTFVTLGTFAEELLVAARVESQEKTSSNRFDYALLRVPAKTLGVRCTERPPAPLVSEIPHAEVRFENVILPENARLSGDGWERYVKPFRTEEDLHVLAASVGFLLATVVRNQCATTLAEDAVSILAGLEAFSPEERHTPAAHLALAGLLPRARNLWSQLLAPEVVLAASERAALERDGALLMVAEGARAVRTSRAWERLQENVR